MVDESIYPWCYLSYYGILGGNLLNHIKRSRIGSEQGGPLKYSSPADEAFSHIRNYIEIYIA